MKQQGAPHVSRSGKPASPQGGGVNGRLGGGKGNDFGFIVMVPGWVSWVHLVHRSLGFYHIESFRRVAEKL